MVRSSLRPAAVCGKRPGMERIPGRSRRSGENYAERELVQPPAISGSLGTGGDDRTCEKESLNTSLKAYRSGSFAYRQKTALFSVGLPR